jgi:hypothetical protein
LITNSKIAKIADLPALTEEQRDDAAFRARDLGWSALVRAFDHRVSTERLTYQALGQRIKRSRSHVQRWLSSPFNLSLGSLGLLAEGLNADLVISLEPRVPIPLGKNSCHPSEAADGTVRSRSNEVVVVTTRTEAKLEASVVTSPTERDLAVVAG